MPNWGKKRKKQPTILNYEMAESINISWQYRKYIQIILIDKFSPLKAETTKLTYNV